MHARLAAFGLSLAFAAPLTHAQDRIPEVDRKMPGPSAQVLVLGSVHLSQLSNESFRVESLQPVLDRLAAFKPDVVTIESLSGEQCDLLALHPTTYPPEDIAPYCKTPSAAKAATGLDVTAAIAAAYETLRDWPAQPTPAQRRHLAAVFLAAADEGSALVQWLQLPADERKAGDGLDTALVAQLQKYAASRNENYSIGSTLAARLGLQRVYAVDDHTGDSMRIADSKAFEDAVRQAWSTGSAAAQPDRDRSDALAKSGDMLALYRFINDPKVQRTAIDSDFGAAMRDPSAEHYGRQYVGGWETRNLRMVANIRATFRQRPDARVLVIVGSSHKPWFDGLLAQLQGVELVDVAKVLK
jgi:hypothetical protein